MYRPVPPPSRPCVRCPWAKTTPPGEFTLQRYEQLRDTVGSPGYEVPPGGPLFACHKSPETRERPCAGWLAVVGWHHLTIRLWVMRELLDASVLESKPGWPDLFDNYDELVRTQAATVDPDSDTDAGTASAGERVTRCDAERDTSTDT